VAPWDAEEDGSDADFEVRGFITPRSAEDPVTGSLNAGLGLWLIGSVRAPDRYIASRARCLDELVAFTSSVQAWTSGWAAIQSPASRAKLTSEAMRSCCHARAAAELPPHELLGKVNLR